MGVYDSFEGKTLEELIEMAENLSLRKSDGHLTLMRFGSGWKIFFGTPMIDGGTGRDQLAAQIKHKTVRDGIVSLLNNSNNIV
jgi:hypothetical protein